MPALGWLALAAAVLLSAPPARRPLRVAALRGRGRLQPRAGARGAAARRRDPGGWGRPAAGAGAAALAATLAAGTVLGGPAIGVAAGALVGTAWRFALDAVRRRRALARHRDLLGAVRVLTAEVEAGAGSSAALASAARAAPAVGELLQAGAAAAARGDSGGAVLAEALDADVRRLGLAWQIGERAGAARADLLARVGADLAAADDQRRAVAVALAGPRASATVLGGLPVLGVGLGVAMGARPVDVLTATAPGRLLCAAGVLLDVLGLLWMRRLLIRAERC